MMFMIPLSFGNMHRSAHTNEICKKATLVKKKIIWRKNPKHAKIIIFRIT